MKRTMMTVLILMSLLMTGCAHVEWFPEQTYDDLIRQEQDRERLGSQPSTVNIAKIQ